MLWLNLMLFGANVTFVSVIFRKPIRAIAAALSKTALVLGWKTTAILTAMVLRAKIQQWWGKNIEQIEDNRYVLTHVIDGKLVKVVVSPVLRVKQLVKVENGCGVDLTEYALPYFQTVPVKIDAGFFFEQCLRLVDADENIVLKF